MLRDGLRSAGRCAIARVVISRKELLVLLRPLGRLVAVTALEFTQRVRPAADYESEVAGLESTPAELQLMGTLMESLFRQNLDLAAYRDRYIDGLDALIARRVAEQGSALESGAAAGTDEEQMAALRASLATAGVDPSRPAPELLPSVSRRAEPDAGDACERKTG